MAVVSFPRQHNVATARLTSMHLVLLTALAALSAVHVDAVRVVGSAVGEAQGKPSRQKAMTSKKTTGQDQSTTERERDLRLAHDYVLAVQVADNFKLGRLKDTVDRLEKVRQVVSGSGTYRDPEQRKLVRLVLRDIRLKLDAVKTLVALKEAAGEADDGGSVLPSQRPNICTPGDVEADGDCLTEIFEFCEALDAVRKAFAEGKSEAAAVFEIVGRMTSIKTSRWYTDSRIFTGINQLLNEEKRWVTKETAARAARGEPSDRILGILDMWTGEDIAPKRKSNAAHARAKDLREAYEVVVGTVVNINTTLSSLRTGYDRLHYYKCQLESFLPVSRPPLSDRLQVLLKMYNIKMQLIERRGEQREAEGDVDDGGDVPPTRRVNICSRIDESKVKAEIKMEIEEICAKLDRMRDVVLSNGNVNAESFEVVGRVQALKARPGYAEMPIADEVDLLLAEEGRWAQRNWDEHTNRRKEPPPRFTTAVPTVPPPQVPGAMGDSAQKVLDMLGAKSGRRSVDFDSSFNLTALAESLDSFDIIKQKTLEVDTPRSGKVDAQLTVVKEKWKELDMLSEALRAEGSVEAKILDSQGEDISTVISKSVLGSLGVEKDDPISERVMDSSDAEEDRRMSELGRGSLGEQLDDAISEREVSSLGDEEDNHGSEPEPGSQSAEEDHVIVEDAMAALCVDVDSADLSPEVHSEFDEICRDFRRSRSTVLDGEIATGGWIRAIMDLARGMLALFAAAPRALSDFLLLLAREKIAILRQLAWKRASPDVPPDGSADGVDVAHGTDAAMQAPGESGAPAEASAAGADDDAQ